MVQVLVLVVRRVGLMLLVLLLLLLQTVRMLVMLRRHGSGVAADWRGRRSSVTSEWQASRRGFAVVQFVIVGFVGCIKTGGTVLAEPIPAGP